MKTLIRNVTIFQTKEPISIDIGVDILIEDSFIKRVEKKINEKVDYIIDGKGKIAIPGLVCAHHHYYSAFSRGMLISSGPQTDFIQVLKEWWWRLDRALDEEALYYSSLVSSIDAVLSGTTSVIDHHSSPNFIKDSLSIIARGMEEVGLRGSTCFEVTDRNRGEKELNEGIKENIRFSKERDKINKEKGDDGLVEAMLGAHAPFTIPDYGLLKLREAEQETNKGIHIHIAEDKYDQVFSHHFYQKDIVKRLDSFSLLDEKSLLVHGLYLNDEEINIINSRSSFFAHNGRSNMNNSVGYNYNLPKIKNLVLGTDGCSGDMFEEAKIDFFKHKDEKGPFTPSEYLKALTRGTDLVESNFSSRFKLGRIEKDYKADLVLISYSSPTPLLKENAASHFIWGMSSKDVETVLINGKVVLENRGFKTIDIEKIYYEAQKVAKKVWEKTEDIR